MRPFSYNHHAGDLFTHRRAMLDDDGFCPLPSSAGRIPMNQVLQKVCSPSQLCTQLEKLTMHCPNPFEDGDLPELG